jgi:three-Cys-motif partner protein
MRSNLLRTDQPDGLKTTPIGRWALDKYALVSLYAELFSTGMKAKWPTRVYVDLCAGSGFSEIDGGASIYWGSPLLALGVPHPFDRYIFCERDSGSFQALQTRVARIFPVAATRFVEGNCDERLDEIAMHIPNDPGVLTFCFADPFDLSIKFSSVRQMASRRIDFLFMLALHMDANRNAAHYANKENRKIDEFLDLPNWRGRWKESEAKGMAFPRFLAEQFSERMTSIGYLPMPFHSMKQIRSDGNKPLYHLALFSKHQRALDFWNQVRKYSTDQTFLEFDQ